MYVSKAQEYREVTESLAEMKKRRDALKSEVQPQLDLVDLVKQEIASNGWSSLDIAMAICPEIEGLLSKGVQKSGASTTKSGKTRKARSIKVYVNPHSGERVETKGGNHKTLKEWKAKWGGAVVESWVEAA